MRIFPLSLSAVCYYHCNPLTSMSRRPELTVAVSQSSPLCEGRVRESLVLARQGIRTASRFHSGELHLGSGPWRPSTNGRPAELRETWVALVKKLSITFPEQQTKVFPAAGQAGKQASTSRKEAHVYTNRGPQKCYTTNPTQPLASTSSLSLSLSNCALSYIPPSK